MMTRKHIEMILRNTEKWWGLLRALWNPSDGLDLQGSLHFTMYAHEDYSCRPGIRFVGVCEDHSFIYCLRILKALQEGGYLCQGNAPLAIQAKPSRSERRAE